MCNTFYPNLHSITYQCPRWMPKSVASHDGSIMVRQKTVSTINNNLTFMMTTATTPWDKLRDEEKKIFD